MMTSLFHVNAGLRLKSLARRQQSPGRRFECKEGSRLRIVRP